MFRMTHIVRWIALAVIVFSAFKARAVPLDPLSTFCTANPTECRKGSVSLLTARGIGTNEYYVVEVDPTTGEVPVAAAITLPYDQDYGTPGASTLRTASMLGVGSTAVSNANPVPISDAGGSITVDGSVAVTSLPAYSYADSVRNDYSGVNVTTGAWVQLIASTAADIAALTIFDSCGQTLELGTGGGGAETRRLIIPPGGIDGQLQLAIPAGTRVSIRAVSGNCTSGEIDITGFDA